MPEPAAESSPQFVTEDRSFVTVAEAARALGLSERQARRRAAALEATGRSRTDGRTRLVTVADMMTVRPDADKKSSLPSEKPSRPVTGQHSEATGRTSEHDRTDGHSPVVPPEVLAELAALRAEKEGLIARLADATRHHADTASDRDAWKSQAQELTQALQRAQDEARAARLIGQRPVQQIESSGLSGGDSTGDTVPGGGIVPPDQDKPVGTGFWGAVARLFGRGG